MGVGGGGGGLGGEGCLSSGRVALECTLQTCITHFAGLRGSRGSQSQVMLTPLTNPISRQDPPPSLHPVPARPLCPLWPLCPLCFLCPLCPAARL